MNIQPADGMIAAALADIEKWEREAPRFNAPSKKRTLRLLSLTQDRLNQSGHKEDPSWANAQERLVALKGLLEGSAPTTTALPVSSNSATKPSVPSPKPITAPSMISSDRVRLHKLMRELESALRGVQGLCDTQSLQREASKVERMEQQLSPFRVNFPQDGDVQNTLQMLQTFKERLEHQEKSVAANATMSQSSSSPSVATSSGSTQMLSHDRTRLIKLRRDCESAVNRLDRKRFTDASYLQQATSGHARMREQLQRYMANFAEDPDVQATAQALERYGTEIAQARVIGVQDAQRATTEALVTEIVRASSEIQRWGPAPFQDESYSKKQFDLLKEFKYRQDDIPRDEKVSEKLGGLEQLITTFQDTASKILAELGDWRATFEEVQVFASSPKPIEPSIPYQASTIKDFFTEATQFESQGLLYESRLSTIIAKAYIPNVDEGNRLKSILWKVKDSIRTLQTSMQCVASNLESQMEHMNPQLDWFATKDPLNALDQVNIFIGNSGDQQEERLEEMLVNTQAAVAYASVANKSDLLTAYQALETRIKSTKEKFVGDRLVAWNSLRMPKPAVPTVCSYSELEETARTTLANPKYKVGEIVRLVVNTDKRCGLSRQEREVTIKDVDSFAGEVTFSGTETVTTWKWDEFQCCTAEAGEDGKYYLYYNTLKFFTSGSRVTPLNKWIIGDRHLSTEIAFDNIAKD